MCGWSAATFQMGSWVAGLQGSSLDREGEGGEGIGGARVIPTRVLAQAGILAIWRNSGPSAGDPRSARSPGTVVREAVPLPLRSSGQGWRREGTRRSAQRASCAPALLGARFPGMLPCMDTHILLMS